MIDLRSDTVTEPCEKMRSAMANAPVGDDVIDVDPTVKRLQELTAEMLGKEAAMFMPSGTMTNQVAVRYHCPPGSEFVCEEGCHIYNYEQGAYAQLSGLASRTIEAPKNVIRTEHLVGKIRPFDEHAVQTKLLCLENTHNRGGGKILPYDSVESTCGWAHEHGLKTHLDGARLFNAAIGSEYSLADWSKHFDTVSVCFSKGLGAPVGSALAGPQEMIETIRRHRKLFGGGMRQSGIIAAGALFALENNFERLAEDHQTAQIIAHQVSQIEGVEVDPNEVHTNIVIFRIDPAICSAAEFCDIAHAQGVWMFPFSAEHVRAVTHLHISHDDAENAGQKIQQIFEKMASKA